jgi:hypothetical protein
MQIDKIMNWLRYGWKCKETERWVNGHMDKQTETRAVGQSERHKHGQVGRQTDRLCTDTVQKEAHT